MTLLYYLYIIFFHIVHIKLFIIDLKYVINKKSFNKRFTNIIQIFY